MNEYVFYLEDVISKEIIAMTVTAKDVTEASSKVNMEKKLYYKIVDCKKL